MFEGLDLSTYAAAAALVLGLVMFGLLGLLSYIDIKTRTLPNKYVLLFAVCGFCYALLIALVQDVSLLAVASNNVIHAVLIMLLAMLPALFIRKGKRVDELSSQESGSGSVSVAVADGDFSQSLVGGGDIKLLGAIALCMGVLSYGVLFAGCVLALVINVILRRKTFAFGPYLAFCAAVVLVLQWVMW